VDPIFTAPDINRLRRRFPEYAPTRSLLGIEFSLHAFSISGFASPRIAAISSNVPAGCGNLYRVETSRRLRQPQRHLLASPRVPRETFEHQNPDFCVYAGEGYGPKLWTKRNYHRNSTSPLNGKYQQLSRLKTINWSQDFSEFSEDSIHRNRSSTLRSDDFFLPLRPTTETHLATSLSCGWRVAARPESEHIQPTVGWRSSRSLEPRHGCSVWILSGIPAKFQRSTQNVGFERCPTDGSAKRV